VLRTKVSVISYETVIHSATNLKVMLVTSRRSDKNFPFHLLLTWVNSWNVHYFLVEESFPCVYLAPAISQMLDKIGTLLRMSIYCLGSNDYI
jgi:hypothetical protein